jgi:hypothetical protein
MAEKTVVLFCGNAGMGKDTASDILATMTGGVKMAYADPLKDAVSAMLGIPKAILYGTQEQKETYKVYDKSARHWLQFVGTELGRNQIHPDLWVHRLVDRVVASNAWFIFCSDCRFKNEIDTFKERLLLESVAGAVKVVAVRIINPRVAVNLAHRSESEIYNLPVEAFDVVLMNDGSLDDLRTKLRSFAKQHLDVHIDDSVVRGHAVP